MDTYVYILREIELEGEEQNSVKTLYICIQ